MQNLFKNISKFTFLFSFLILFPIITFAACEPVGDCIADGGGAGIWCSDGTCIPAPATGSTPSVSGIAGLLLKFQQILNAIVPVLVALGVVFFVWGVVQYVIAGGEEAKKKGKDRIIYGLIGFAVIVGLWGLVNIVVNTFGLSGATPPSLSSVTDVNATDILPSNPKFQDVLSYISSIINSSVIPLIFALATVMFVWGVVQFFIINANEEAKRAQGKQFMIWGIIALAVMLSVWGLVGILGTTFGIDDMQFLPEVTPP
jgi:hypothetical protein